MGLGGLFTMESFSDGQYFGEEALGALVLQGTGVGVSAMPATPIDAAELAALIAYLREATQ
jgi:mono/diheme cytochrome c family protein